MCQHNKHLDACCSHLIRAYHTNARDFVRILTAKKQVLYAAYPLAQRLALTCVAHQIDGTPTKSCSVCNKGVVDEALATRVGVHSASQSATVALVHCVADCTATVTLIVGTTRTGCPAADMHFNQCCHGACCLRSQAGRLFSQVCLMHACHARCLLAPSGRSQVVAVCSAERV